VSVRAGRHPVASALAMSSTIPSVTWSTPYRVSVRPGSIARRAYGLNALHLIALERRIVRRWNHGRLLAIGKLVDANDHLLPRFDLLRVGESGLLDLALDEALLDRGDRTAELVDPLDQLTGTLLELITFLTPPRTRSAAASSGAPLTCSTPPGVPRSLIRSSSDRVISSPIASLS